MTVPVVTTPPLHATPRRRRTDNTSPHKENAPNAASDLAQVSVSVSVVILTARRRRVIEDCLSALLPQARAHRAQVIIGCNNDPGSARWLADRYPDIEVVDLPSLALGAARNRLITRCTGELVLFLDDDTIAPKDLLDELVGLAVRHPEVGVFGGPNPAVPSGSRFVAAQDAVLCSLHTGPIRHRFRNSSANGWSLCLCNLAIRTELQPRFDEHVTAGEETELLRRIRHTGTQLVAYRELAVPHRRRDTLRAFAAQMYKYGHGRGQAQPLASVGAATTAALAATFAPKPARHIVGVAYLTAVITTAARTAHQHRSPVTGMWAAVTIPVLHASYTAGAIAGALNRRPAKAQG